jgi:uncharacterized protein YqgV (UPF0045/DUF77 family)
MIGISVQVSLYPLGQTDFTEAIDAFIEVLRERGLSPQVGGMSTLVFGDDEEVYAALRAAYARAVEFGPAVMNLAVSNACPVSLPDGREERGDG